MLLLVSAHLHKLQPRLLLSHAQRKRSGLSCLKTRRKVSKVFILYPPSFSLTTSKSSCRSIFNTIALCNTIEECLRLRGVCSLPYLAAKVLRCADMAVLAPFSRAVATEAPTLSKIMPQTPTSQLTTVLTTAVVSHVLEHSETS